MTDFDMVDRAQGCLMGQIAGDSLGALVEFETAATIAKLYPDGLNELAAGGPWNIIAGQPTDDSELALALARSMVRTGRYDAEAVFESYRAWLASEPFDVGGTTRTALTTPFAEAGRRTGASQANGSLMRVSPIGIAAAGRPDVGASLAEADSLLTHPHPICVASCRAYVAAVAVGVAGGGRTEMIDAALAQAGSGSAAETVRGVIEVARSQLPVDFQQQMGWVLIALQNAFHHLAAGSSVELGVIATVIQGGDTDTNGAIVGALLGAADGFARVPLQWRLAMLSCRPTAAAGAPRPRPADYWPHDALDLSEALLGVAGYAD